MHQASFAIGQKRPVYVVNQEEFEWTEAEDGFVRLIEMGATPVRNPDELVRELRRKCTETES
jgi:predicted Rossmann fold nucleotide-binding protein DprA/Smf involved in DNA uptake